MATHNEDEPPLDPVLENVRRKLVRRMAWSLGIMMVGLMAVLGAIVYKISTPESDKTSVALGAPQTIEIELDEGHSVGSAQLEGGLVLVETTRSGQNPSYMVIDLESGQVHTRINFK